MGRTPHQFTARIWYSGFDLQIRQIPRDSVRVPRSGRAPALRHQNTQIRAELELVRSIAGRKMRLRNIGIGADALM